ncbi:MAG: hypothetical protein QOH26_1775, partial [Actinomycetota bacterium]|nr:hypothetical protein [Actinomycetota bacterium]
YDLVADPYQLTSLHREPSTKPVRQRLAKLIDRFRDCAGESCVVTGFSAS